MSELPDIKWYVNDSHLVVREYVTDLEKELTELREYKAAIEAQDPVGWEYDIGFYCDKQDAREAAVGFIYPLFTNKVKEIE